MSQTYHRSHKHAALLTPDPLSRRMREDVEREPIFSQCVEKGATLVLPLIGCGPLEVPICKQSADVPAAGPWHREVSCGCNEMDPPLCGSALMSHNGSRSRHHHSTIGASAMKHALHVVGLDSAKRIFPLVGLDDRGKII